MRVCARWWRRGRNRGGYRFISCRLLSHCTNYDVTGTTASGECVWWLTSGGWEMNLMRRAGHWNCSINFASLSLTLSFSSSLALVSRAFKCICDLVMGDSGSLLNPFSIARSLHLSPWPAGFLLDEGWDLHLLDRRKNKLWVFPSWAVSERCYRATSRPVSLPGQGETKYLTETRTH